MTALRSLAGLILLVALVGCNVNSSVEIPDGARSDGDASTVNGSVKVGNDAIVDGDVGNVNGSIRIGNNAKVNEIGNVNGGIRLGDGASASSVESVNGSIALGANVTVEGDVGSVNGSVGGEESVQIGGELSTVNGTISLESGSSVAEGIITTNGNIRLIGTTAASLETRNGSMDLLDGTRIEGQLRVRETNNSSNSRPQIGIGPDVVVVGPLVFERDVDLYVHETAQVGEIQGAEAMPYPEGEDQ